MKRCVDYVKNRLNERSFWVGVTMAISAAALLPYPWNVMSFCAGVMASLVADGKMVDRDRRP